MAQQIVVIGAGFAGMWAALSAARALDIAKRSDLTIVLIAPKPELDIRPRFYEANPDVMKAPLQPIFDSVGVSYIKGSVDCLRTREGALEYVGDKKRRQTLNYDQLVLASGSRLVLPEVPGLKEHAFSVDQLEEAVQLEKHIESLRCLPNTAARNTVVVVGAGFTGIETAAEMPARLRAVLGNSALINVELVERANAVGPELGPGPRPVILRAMEKLGITVTLNSTVKSIDANGVVLNNGSRIESLTVIWTAGVRASALTEQVPAQRDQLGRLIVDPDLNVTGVQGIFAAGDVAFAATDNQGSHAMMSCQHAMSLGRVAGHNAASRLLGHPTIPYRQPKYVTCLDLGPWGAVYTEGWHREVKMLGAEAKALKKQINSEWIYPPKPIRADVFAVADPLTIIVA
jgi:NADH dehydrogenase